MGQSTTAQSLNLQHLQGGSATKVSFSSSPQKLQFAGNGIYPGSGGSCGTSVGSGACTVALAVVPEATGSFSQPLTVTYEDGKRTRTISLTATGQVYFPPDLELLPATQDIGEVFVRGTATIPLTVRYKKGDVPAIGLAFLGIADDMGFPGGTYPGGGTCETQLDPNTSSCTLNLYITPTRQGRETRTLRLLYRSGNEWVSSQAAFTYNAIPPAELGSTPTTIAFGNVATGLSATRTFTITHVQGQPPATQIRASSPASFGFAGGSYPGTGGTCSDRLEVGASCTVVMDFTPMVRGTYSSNLVLTYFDGVGDSELRVPLEGTTQAALQLSLSSQSPAGSVVTGATATSTLTVTHAGGSAATGLLPSVNHAAFSLSAGTCGGTLTSGSCTYTVTFAPVAAGNISGELGVAFNNGFTNDSTTISITGTAIAAATISSNPQSLDFGEMVTTANWTRNITLTNSSGAAVPANAISITGVTAPFSIASTPPAQLNPGQSAQLTIRAQPTVRGTFASTVTVSYFDGARTQTLAVPLSLRALQAATVSIHATSSYDYGYVQAQSQSAPRTFEIRHTAGDVDATVSFSLAYGFQFEGGSFPGTSGTCRSTRVISPGQSCLVAIIFSPPGPGNYGGSFASSMSYSNGASTQYHFPAFAGKSNGRPALGNHDFGSKITGTTTTVSLTVSYQGHTPITNLSARITGGSGAFEFTGGGPYPGIGGNCGAQLSSGSCRISVTFRPQTAGSHSATITLDFESGAGPMSTTASLSGMGSAAALLQVSGNGTATGVQLINSNSDLTFTLSNSTGSVAAISISASPLTAPFSFKGGLYPGSGGNCGSSLAAGSTCRVVLNFRPTSAGVASGQLLLSYFTGATTSQVSQSLSGIGGNAAQLTPSPASIDFGLVMPGQSSTLSVGFANSASAVPATLFRFDALSSPFTLVTHNCPSSGSGLAASSSCEATIRFSPAASGRYSSEIRLTTFDGAVDRTIRIPVAGRTPAEYQISPSDHLDVDERAVGGTHTFTYTLTRIGGPNSTALQGAVVSSAGPGTFSFSGGSFPGTGGTCTNPLTTDSCTIRVSFGLSGLGPFSGTWSVTAETGDGDAAISRTLEGLSKTPATLQLSDSSLAFPATPVGGQSQLAIVITNSGEMTLSGLAGAISGAPASVMKFSGGSFPGLGGSCKASLKGKDSCTAVLEFNPPDRATYSSVAGFQGFNGLTSIGPFTTTLSHAATTGASKPAISVSVPRQWGIPDIDGDGLWDILWLETEYSDSVLIIGSSTGGEIGRLSREEAEGLIPH